MEVLHKNILRARPRYLIDWFTSSTIRLVWRDNQSIFPSSIRTFCLSKTHTGLNLQVFSCNLPFSVVISGILKSSSFSRIDVRSQCQTSEKRPLIQICSLDGKGPTRGVKAASGGEQHESLMVVLA